MTTILLADDHAVVRQGLRALLVAEPGFSVVGEASDGHEAVEMAVRLRPDVVVTDIAMPGLGGLDVALVISKRLPSTRTVILTMHTAEAYVAQALRNGASAYVLKDAGCAELVRAVRAAASGRRYLSPPFSEQGIESHLRRSADAEVGIYETLTAREREVLALESDGMTASQIGTRLGISPRTAEAHRIHVMRKLGVHTKAELIRWVLTRRAPDAGGASGAAAPGTEPR